MRKNDVSPQSINSERGDFDRCICSRIHLKLREEGLKRRDRRALYVGGPLTLVLTSKCFCVVEFKWFFICIYLTMFEFHKLLMRQLCIKSYNQDNAALAICQCYVSLLGPASKGWTEYVYLLNPYNVVDHSLLRFVLCIINISISVKCHFSYICHAKLTRDSVLILSTSNRIPTRGQ